MNLYNTSLIITLSDHEKIMLVNTFNEHDFLLDMDIGNTLNKVIRQDKTVMLFLRKRMKVENIHSPSQKSIFILCIEQQF